MPELADIREHLKLQRHSFKGRVQYKTDYRMRLSPYLRFTMYIPEVTPGMTNAYNNQSLHVGYNL